MLVEVHLFHLEKQKERDTVLRSSLPGDSHPGSSAASLCLSSLSLSLSLSPSFSLSPSLKPPNTYRKYLPARVTETVHL